MSSLRILVALSCIVLITACASATDHLPPDAAAKAGGYESHHPTGAAPEPSTALMQERLNAMREMRDKMMNAKTFEERQALMADHMKAMQDGMQMMKDTMGADAKAEMGDRANPKAAPGDMAAHHGMTEDRMEMMQMMLEMMMQRMPAYGAMN